MKRRKAFNMFVSALSALAMTAGSIAVLPVNAQAATKDYAKALKLSLYFYDANQCGPDTDGNGLTWRGACHNYDAKASLDRAVGLDGTAKSIIRAQNGGKNTVDLSGGYHDAGDHIKSAMTMGFSCASIAWAYYSYKDIFDKTGSSAHAKYIMKEMSDYFMRATYLDNSGKVAALCYLVSDSGDHVYWQSPEKQNYDRPTYWATPSHPSADTAGEMAAGLAGTSLAFKDSDPGYAAKCLKYAKALRDFAKKYPSTSSEGIGDMYKSDSQADDIAWADLWCHLAEGKMSSYRPIAYNGSYGGSYDGWLYSWNKVWGGYAALLSQLGYSEYTTVVKNDADRLLKNPQSGRYYVVGDSWGASRYSCIWQLYSLKYAEKSGDRQYIRNAQGQMDYLLGDNATGTSFVIGYGDKYPRQPHHRAANQSKGVAEHILYGTLVGGPKDESGNYDDYWESYQCTEPALDYQACFVLAASALCKATGQTDASGADAVIRSAGEINGNVNFGGNSTPAGPTQAPARPTATPKPTQAPARPTATPKPTQAPDQGQTETLANGWYYIKNVNAQKYLTVAGNSGRAAANVEILSGNGSQGQKWYLENRGNGYFTLKSGLGNYNCDIAYGRDENEANIQIYDAHGADAQQFAAKKVAGTAGVYAIATRCSNGTKVFDVYGRRTADGTNVMQWTYTGAANQQWIFEPVNGQQAQPTATPKPTKAPTQKPAEPTKAPQPSGSGLALSYSINDWGSGYQVSLKVENKGSREVNGWTLKLKKSDVNVASSWNVNIKENGSYYVITPVSWNSTIPAGGSVEFGICGSGHASSSIGYTFS